MPDWLKKYGFAAAVASVLAALCAVALVRVVGEGAVRPSGAPSSAQQARAPGGRPGGDVPGVEVAVVEARTFYAVTPSIGTAQALESVTITSKVTDVIQRMHFESGDRVQRGQTLVTLANVEQSADLAEARASLEVEAREYDRIKELAERGFAPRARLEAARAAFERAEARVDALQARIADRTIRAPFSGVMGLRTASPGALARPGEPIATLDDVSSIKLDFDVSEPQLALVRKGAAIVARTPALPGEVFDGTVAELDSRVDPRSRTLKARAVLPNRSGKLKPGMLLTVEVRADPRQGLAAPELAILESSDGAAVFRVVERDGATTVERAPVKIGRRADGMIEVLAGLNANDRVVSVGVQRVRPNQPVRILEPTPLAAPRLDAPAPAARS